MNNKKLASSQNDTNSFFDCQCQASFELRMLKISNVHWLQKLPDLIEMFSHLEELRIECSLEETDITSFVKSLKQLGNLRSLELCFEGGGFFSGNLDLRKGRDSTHLEVSTSSCMRRLETIQLKCLKNISKLLISGEICPLLRSLAVEQMRNLNEMNLMQLNGLNTLKVWKCPKLETVPGLSSLRGLQEFDAWKCEGLKSLPTLAPLRHLERIRIGDCHQLQSVEGIEELQGLNSVAIEVPDNGYAWVRNCINGLRRLPLNKIVLIQKAAKASSHLNVNLFSEVIGAQAVDEIEREDYHLEMRSSSNAVTIYALFVKPCRHVKSGVYESLDIESNSKCVLSCTRKDRRKEMITILLTQHNNRYYHLEGLRIKKGFKATMNEGEEGKALTLLQRIVDRLYGESKVVAESESSESESESESDIFYKVLENTFK